MAPDVAPLSLREAQKQLTRTRLVDAAREVFEARGYAAATIDDIVSRAGASRATFYLHFNSKVDVLQELSASLVDGATAYYGRLDVVLSTGSRKELRSWMEDAIGWFELHRALLPALDEAAMVEPEIRALSGQNLELLVGSMHEYLAAWPRERREEARLRVVLLILQLDRFFRTWAISHSWNVDRELVVDVLSDMWFSNLRPPRRR